MRHFRTIALVIAMFICALSFQVPRLSAQVNAPNLATDQSIYTFFGIGGTVTVTASQLASNATFYLWLQGPTDSNPHTTPAIFQGKNGPSTSFSLTIHPYDPAGTYTLTLSSSNRADTSEVVAHFGVFGTSKTTYQRTEQVLVSGGGFSPNSTLLLKLSATNGTLGGFPVNVTLGPKGDFYNFSYKIPVNGLVGSLTITATGKAYDNSQLVDTRLEAQVTDATITFRPHFQNRIQRASATGMPAVLTYPDGSLLTSNVTGAVVNMTISAANFTLKPAMKYNATTLAWNTTFTLAVNATLGTYTILLTARDGYGNNGTYTSAVSVIPAELQILHGKDIKTGPGQLIDVSVLVRYPNGSLVTDQEGGQVIAYTNSSSEVIPYLMFFNSTDLRYHTPYRSPQLGWNFGATDRLFFNATDEYGNAGVASKSFNIQVGADTTTIILGVIGGAIVPVILLGWAIFAISKRRRKYKP
jgi:hypothetical protein